MRIEVDALSRLLDVILDDLSARFIINLPEEELSSVTRICFGLEQAHWFYEDFFRPQYPALPSVNLRAFTAALFSHCPLLWKFSGQHEEAFDDFLKYKIRVPVRGAIMLDQDMNKCVLVKGWKSSAGWGFPKGKIDQEEDDADCAIREVKEECGFDVSAYLDKNAYIDLVMKEQSVRLYIIRGIPLDTNFEPQTRKEISKIDWFKLNDLPTYKKNPSSDPALNLKSNKYYMVAPFLGPLRRWIKKHRPAKTHAVSEVSLDAAKPLEPLEEVVVDVPDTTAETVDTSSQALKLLLGIADASESPRASEQASINRQGSSDRIDLASLFQKTETAPDSTSAMEDRSYEAAARAHSTNVFNTSIEASIWDQLQPSSGHHQEHANAHRALLDDLQYRTPSSIHSQQPPPWMSHHQMRSQQAFHAAGHTDPTRIPQPPPNILHQPMGPPNLYNISPLHASPPKVTEPPGFARSQHVPMQAGPIYRNTSSPVPKNNPNALALLALLKPKQPDVTTQSRGTEMVENVELVASREPEFSEPVASRQAPAPPPGHKQSLLALLKPANSPSSNGNNVVPLVPQHMSLPPATHPAQATSVAMSNKDAFLLDYLTRAANIST